MTVTLEIPPEREAAMRDAAARQGLTLEQWLLRVAQDAAPGVTPGVETWRLQLTDPAAWSRRLREASERYGVRANLPDEALTRESIYDDSGR